MIETFSTTAETRASEACSLPAFDQVNLLGIKRKLETILGLIGRDGLFDEYTRHDITHLDEMLKLLSWLIPGGTVGVMSPADWLMTVLAIYFHDIGMLVTRDEYARRSSSGFHSFCEQRLFSDDAGVDYKARVDELPPADRERFLYQEFVRHTHAERSREWVMGKAPERLGITHAAMQEVNALLDPLDPQFRRDLALICESHHLDDLGDLRKYKTAQPYGNSDAETANLQYVAVLLRSADLLHMTRDRTPSTLFRLINPLDPISQREWAKQMAVKRVRSQFGKDKDGLPDESAPRHTIEVHAYFTQPDGFFGLTSYLAYVQAQLQLCFDWVSAASRTQATRHEFPWRYIDDSQIETEGFLRDSFEFTIDQARILDLLTGHTLYNETTVVLRELVQNALDAVRLQQLTALRAGWRGFSARVAIHWDSRERVLTVQDNGTGMTQATIERHLLKIGSSKYQDPEFKKEFPEFSAISRFGIGVLSTFMIADHVEILTSHPDEPKVRSLTLRSVHGKYLIQLLDRNDAQVPEVMRANGTIVRLRVRASATISDVAATARKWIVVPGCEVTLAIDAGQTIAIGFDSPKAALEAAILSAKVPQSAETGQKLEQDVRVDQVTIDNVTIAYALR